MENRIVKLLNTKCKECRNLKAVKEKIFEYIDIKFSNFSVGTHGNDDTILLFNIDSLAFQVKAIKVDKYNFQLC